MLGFIDRTPISTFLIVSLTLGLAPFFPEPHICGKAQDADGWHSLTSYRHLRSGLSRAAMDCFWLSNCPVTVLVKTLGTVRSDWSLQPVRARCV